MHLRRDLGRSCTRDKMAKCVLSAFGHGHLPRQNEITICTLANSSSWHWGEQCVNILETIFIMLLILSCIQTTTPLRADDGLIERRWSSLGVRTCRFFIHHKVQTWTFKQGRRCTVKNASGHWFLWKVVYWMSFACWYYGSVCRIKDTTA